MNIRKLQRRLLFFICNSNLSKHQRSALYDIIKTISNQNNKISDLNDFNLFNGKIFNKTDNGDFNGATQ